MTSPGGGGGGLAELVTNGDKGGGEGVTIDVKYNIVLYLTSMGVTDKWRRHHQNFI